MHMNSGKDALTLFTVSPAVINGSDYFTTTFSKSHYVVEMWKIANPKACCQGLFKLQAFFLTAFIFGISQVKGMSQEVMKNL